MTVDSIAKRSVKAETSLDEIRLGFILVVFTAAEGRRSAFLVFPNSRYCEERLPRPGNDAYDANLDAS